MPSYIRPLSAFLLAAIILLGQDVPQARARPNEGNSAIADAFLNEELVYQIGFWFFDDVAVGDVTLEKGEDGEYVAKLVAYTTGVVEWALRHRKDTYVAHLRTAEGGKRFVTKSFEKTIDTGGKVRKTVTNLDYDNMTMTWKKWDGDKIEKEGEQTIQPGSYYDDPLAAFYNFRFGVYGPVEEGRVYKILTFPKEDRVPEIYLRVAKKEEMERRAGDKLVLADYLADVKIDKELFGSGSGEVEILFTSEIMPVEAVAKDVLFFGDVRGKLVRMGLIMGFVKNTPFRRVNLKTPATP